MSPATLVFSASATSSPSKLHAIKSSADAIGTKGGGTLIAMARKDAPGAAPAPAVHDATGSKKCKADSHTAGPVEPGSVRTSPHKVNGSSAAVGDDITSSLKSLQRLEEMLADPIKFVKDRRPNANETSAALAARGIHPVNVPLPQNEGESQRDGVSPSPVPSTSAEAKQAESSAPPSSKDVWNPISAHGGKHKAAIETSPVLTARQKEKARSMETEEEDEEQRSPNGMKAAVTHARPTVGFRPDDLYPFLLRLDWPSSATISTGLGNHGKWTASPANPSELTDLSTCVSGNTCYMNSTLQVLLHTPPLVEILLNPQKLAYIVDQHTRNVANNPSGSPFSKKPFGPSPNKGRNGYGNGADGGGNFNLLVILARLADTALIKRQHQGGGGGQYSKNKTIWPRQLSDNLPAFAKGLRKGRQEDAHEFLRLLLENLQSYCLQGLDEKT